MPHWQIPWEAENRQRDTPFVGPPKAPPTRKPSTITARTSRPSTLHATSPTKPPPLCRNLVHDRRVEHVQKALSIVFMSSFRFIWRVLVADHLRHFEEKWSESSKILPMSGHVTDLQFRHTADRRLIVRATCPFWPAHRDVATGPTAATSVLRLHRPEHHSLPDTDVLEGIQALARARRTSTPASPRSRRRTRQRVCTRLPASSLLRARCTGPRVRTSNCRQTRWPAPITKEQAALADTRAKGPTETTYPSTCGLRRPDHPPGTNYPPTPNRRPSARPGDQPRHRP